jgi:DNA topoisomerase IB
VELTTTSSTSPMIKALSADFTIKAYDYIANENTAGLYQMGLNDEAVSCLVKMENKDIRLVIMAFEQALSIQTYVDPDIIKKVLINNSKQQQEEVLANNLVRSGAGFEMIRYFIKTYTNRKHTVAPRVWGE